MEAHHRGHHDMGGQSAGPIDRREHALAPWEKRTAALMMVLQDPQRCLITADELRLGIESLGAEEYDRLTYYERWITSIANHLLQRGVFTVDELGRKLAEIEARETKP
jgi:nitrile hydratase subunit beta